MSAFGSSAAFDADFVEVSDQRSADRRRRDRRAGRMRLDPLFAATLLRHVAEPPTQVAPRDYGRTAALVATGVRLNLRA